MSKNIQRMFSEVPEAYRLVNHVLTLGLDYLWRRKAAGIAAEAGGSRWIDLCSGTGDMAASLRRSARNGTIIYAADFSAPMFGKAREKPECAGIEFVLCDVKTLPFPDDTFDLVTSAFATRNINLSRNKLTETFREFRRVLKPGGRFVNLETSQPSSRLMKKLFHLYVKLLVKPVGELLSGSGKPYAYLSSTIPRFYPPEELMGIMQLAGFESGGIHEMSWGVVAVHQGIKPATDVELCCGDQPHARAARTRIE
jgi:demethylmenaquinone methyltransferase/2-methoxy-6-polyprenyl-1,4-benzoquinol methylase